MQIARRRLVKLTAGLRQSDEAVRLAYDYLDRLRLSHLAWLQNFDIQLTPTTLAPPVRTGVFDPRAEDLEAMGAAMFAHINYTPLQNATGMPAISLPLFETKDALPLGSQFTAGFGEEAKLLGLAYELEEAQPWVDRWPSFSASRL